jgi:cobalt-zinc-cadmium efflux system protein
VKSEKRMLISLILNFLFTIFEFIGGLITNSIALISDSIHDFGDTISMAIAIFLEKKSKQKPDYKYTYGYYRFSLLGGLTTSVILIVGSFIIVIEAVKRILNPQPIDAELMIYFAIVGVIVNGIAALNVSKGKSANEKVISLHLLEDVFGWLALLIAAIIMNFYDIDILDAILSLLFTVFILYHVFRNLKIILEVFLEKAPKGFSIDKIKKTLTEDPSVEDVHHVHLWTIEGNVPIITLHAVISKHLNANQIEKVTLSLKRKLEEMGINHSTIQIEFSKNQCSEADCDDLEVPDHHHHQH